MVKRKKPIRHRVRSYKKDNGTNVPSYTRGKGKQRSLKRKVVGRFGERGLFELPTHHVMVVTGLAQEGEPRSRIMTRVATEDPAEAIQIANIVLREEFGFPGGVHDADVFDTPTEARLKSLSWDPKDVPDIPLMDESFFNVIHQKPLYYKSETDEVKEFWQNISYASGSRLTR